MSVARIIKPLQKIESKLQRYVDKQTSQAVKNIEKIDKLEKANQAINDENAQALKISDNIRNLLN